MRATAPCGPTVVPYNVSLGPRGAGAAGRAPARPAGENRTDGAVRVWEKIFAATMGS